MKRWKTEAQREGGFGGSHDVGRRFETNNMYDDCIVRNDRRVVISALDGGGLGSIFLPQTMWFFFIRCLNLAKQQETSEGDSCIVNLSTQQLGTDCRSHTPQTEYVRHESFASFGLHNQILFYISVTQILLNANTPSIMMFVVNYYYRFVAYTRIQCHNHLESCAGVTLILVGLHFQTRRQR